MIKRSSIRNHGSFIPGTARDIGESPFCHHSTGAFLQSREVRRNPRDDVSKALHKDPALSSSVFRRSLVGMMPHTWVMKSPTVRRQQRESLQGLTPVSSNGYLS